MDILDDMGVGKLSAKVFLKVNYSFKSCPLKILILDFDQMGTEFELDVAYITFSKRLHSSESPHDSNKAINGTTLEMSFWRD